MGWDKWTGTWTLRSWKWEWTLRLNSAHVQDNTEKFCNGEFSELFPTRLWSETLQISSPYFPQGPDPIHVAREERSAVHTAVFNDTGLWSIQILRYLWVDSNSPVSAFTWLWFGLNTSQRLTQGENLFWGGTWWKVLTWLVVSPQKDGGTLFS